jgi:uncharacterized protein (DUF488 family)
LEIYTSGTSGITAERFFLRLRELKATSVIDTRIHPSSQLSGYSKQESLKYFLKEILQIPYIYESQLCPIEQDFKLYKNKQMIWKTYQDKYYQLLINRNIKEKIDFSPWGDRPVILCSESSPDQCHRRLAAEFISSTLNLVSEIKHL